MKDWEVKMAEAKLKDNTYTVVSSGQTFLCTRVAGDYFVTHYNQTKLTNIESVFKI